MRIPRDISGHDLVKYLKSYGYIVTRQTGSHIRLTTELNGQHHTTIPNHDPLKIGTLSGIVTDVSEHFAKSKEQLMQELFG